MLYIGYYTRGSAYEREAALWRTVLDTLGLEHHCQPIDDQGSWLKNVQYKARFVREMLDKYPNDRLCYIDVDAVVITRPIFLETLPCDIAASRYNTELLGGTIVVGNSPLARQTVDKWCEFTERYTAKLPDGREAWDQRLLDMAIREVQPVFHQLAPEYCWMPELSQRLYPDSRPIIMHTRGSFRINPKHV